MKLFKKLFVFGKRFDLFISKRYKTFEKIDINGYTDFNNKIIESNEILENYLKNLVNSKATQEDYENLLRTNCVNNDPMYVREVYSFEYADGIFSIAQGDYFDEFFMGSNNTNLVYDLGELKEVPLDEFNGYDLLLRAKFFKDFLEETKNPDSDYTDFESFALRKDKNDNIYFVFNSSKHNLLVSEECIKKATNEYYLDFGIEDSLNKKYPDSIDYKNNFIPNINNQECIDKQKEIFQQFSDLSNGKKYLDNNLLLQIAQITDISFQTIENPIIGTMRLGGFVLSEFVIKPQLEENELGSLATNYLISFSDSLVSNIGINLFEIKLDEKDFSNFIEEVNKKYIQDEITENIPIELTDKDDENNKIDLEL